MFFKTYKAYIFVKFSIKKSSHFNKKKRRKISTTVDDIDHFEVLLSTFLDRILTYTARSASSYQREFGQKTLNLIEFKILLPKSLLPTISLFLNFIGF